MATVDLGVQAANPAKPLKGARVALGMLTFIYVLNFLDRQLLAILAKPIQDSLGVSDTQLGLIGGLYCLISIPVGWLADRSNRVKVLALACTIWSAATVACGMASTYPQLVVARMSVGIGEAGGVPPSYAIISDYFPRGQRGTALGIFNLGPPIGAAMGIAFGASIAAAYSWRLAFILVGAIGIVAALVLLVLVREPVRGGLDAPRADAASTVASAKAGFGETLKMFVSRPELMLAALGSGVTQIVTYGLGNFTTLFLMREKGMVLEEVALWYALVVGIGMSAGIFVSGRMIDRYTRRSRKAYALLPAATLTMAVPLYVTFVWAPSWPMALLFLLGPTFLNYFYLSSCVTLVQEEVRPEQRVMSGALLLLVMNLIGLGLGPTFVGAASDWFRASHPDNSLQMALYTLVPFYFIAIGLFLWLARVLGRNPQSPINGGAHA